MKEKFKIKNGKRLTCIWPTVRSLSSRSTPASISSFAVGADRKLEERSCQSTVTYNTQNKSFLPPLWTGGYPHPQGWGAGKFFIGSGSWLFFKAAPAPDFFSQAAPAPVFFSDCHCASLLNTLVRQDYYVIYIVLVNPPTPSRTLINHVLILLY